MNPISNNRILVIDDNSFIHEDFRKILFPDSLDSVSTASMAYSEAILFGSTPKESSQKQFELEFALQGSEGVEMVNKALLEGRPYAVAFVDVRMPPGLDGVETIARLREADPNLQAVICTAYSDYSWDDMISRLGTSDSLLILKKPFDNIEVIQLAHALTRKWEVTQQASIRMDQLDILVAERTAALQRSNENLKLEIAERTRAEEVSRISQECFSTAFHASPIPLAIQEIRTLHFAEVNNSFITLTGYTREELIGRSPIDLLLSLDPKLFVQLQEHKSVSNVGCCIGTKDHHLRHVLISMETLSLEGESHILLMIQDISEQFHLENQLRNAQETELRRVTNELTRAGANIRTLSGLLPICAHCKGIRDDQGYWQCVESYIQTHTQSELTHGICPDCVKKHFPKPVFNLSTP